MTPTRNERPDFRGRYPHLHAPAVRPRSHKADESQGSAERGSAGQPAGRHHPGPPPAIRACRTAHLTLPARPRAAGLARRATRQVLTTWQLASLSEPAGLIVSELVGNVIRHARAAGGEIGPQLETDGTRMRIEVHDSDPRLPRPRIPGTLDESGLGFTIIEATADRWGVRKTARGKAVWADLHAA